MTVLFRRGPFFEDLEGFNHYLPRLGSAAVTSRRRESHLRRGQRAVADWIIMPDLPRLGRDPGVRRITATGVKSVDSSRKVGGDPDSARAGVQPADEPSDPGLRPILEATPANRAPLRRTDPHAHGRTRTANTISHRCGWSQVSTAPSTKRRSIRMGICCVPPGHRCPIPEVACARHLVSDRECRD